MKTPLTAFFIIELLEKGNSVLNENEKLKTLSNLGIELNQVHDLDILMERILSKAREFVSADAGSIYIREGGSLKFSYTQNETLQKRILPGEKLIYSVFSIPIDCTSLAGYVALTGVHLNIPDVYDLNPDLPYHFNNKFDTASDYRTVSTLTFPLTTLRSGVVGIIQIINGHDDNGQVVPFVDIDEEMMFHFASIAAVALERARMTRATLLRMIKMAEMRDPKETGAHVNRVAGYSVEIYERWARRKGLTEEVIEDDRDRLRMAAMLHDVGKVAISDQILKKPGRFNDEEFEIMKKHTLYGASLFGINRSDYDDAAYEVALCHHERWDGLGYPGYVDLETGEPLKEHEYAEGGATGKSKEEIPIFGRIVALADVFDALSSARVYKEPWEEGEVLDLIRKESGAQFDPELVEIFFSILDVIRSIKKRYSSDISH